MREVLIPLRDPLQQDGVLLKNISLNRPALISPWVNPCRHTPSPPPMHLCIRTPHLAKPLNYQLIIKSYLKALILPKKRRKENTKKESNQKATLPNRSLPPQMKSPPLKQRLKRLQPQSKHKFSNLNQKKRLIC